MASSSITHAEDAERIHNQRYRNWLRSAKALAFLKKGLVNFVDKHMKEQHEHFKFDIKYCCNGASLTCNACTLHCLLPYHVVMNKTCPYQTNTSKQCICPRKGRVACPDKNACGRMHDLIVEHHVHSKPKWSNTCCSKWFTNYWEVAKCFLNTSNQQGKDVSKIDAAGLLSICINNRNMARLLTTGITYFEKSRDARNDIFHSEDLQVKDADFQTYIKAMMAILSDPLVCQDPAATKARTALIQLERDDILISHEDEIEYRKQAIEAIKLKMEELHHVVDRHEEDMQNLKGEGKEFQEFREKDAERVQYVDDRFNHQEREITELKERMEKVVVLLAQYKQLNELRPGVKTDTEVKSVVNLSVAGNTHDNERINSASETLVEVCNDELNGRQTKQQLNGIRREINSSFKTLREDENPVETSTHECVALHIHSKNVDALSRLLDDCIAGKLTALFKPVEAELRKLPDFQDIKIDVVIYEEDFVSCIKDLERRFELNLEEEKSSSKIPSTIGTQHSHFINHQTRDSDIAQNDTGDNKTEATALTETVPGLHRNRPTNVDTNVCDTGQEKLHQEVDNKIEPPSLTQTNPESDRSHPTKADTKLCGTAQYRLLYVREPEINSDKSVSLDAEEALSERSVTKMEDMCDYKDIFRDTESQNWFKVRLALQFVKDGLQEFMLDRISKFHQSILGGALYRTTSPQGTVCNQCKTQNVLPCPTNGICRGRRCTFHQGILEQPRQCPTNGICHAVRDAIKAAHMYGYPSWKNTHAELWSNNPWEIAKCFLPPDGYAHVSSIEETDFNGVVSILLNCLTFQRELHTDVPDILTHARDIGRNIRHSADLRLSDIDLARSFSVLKDLLTYPARLSPGSRAENAIRKLYELEAVIPSVNTTNMHNLLSETRREIEIEKDTVLNDLKMATDSIVADLARIFKLQTDLLITTDKHIACVKGDTRREIENQRDNAVTELTTKRDDILPKIEAMKPDIGDSENNQPGSIEESPEQSVVGDEQFGNTAVKATNMEMIGKSEASNDTPGNYQISKDDMVAENKPNIQDNPDESRNWFKACMALLVVKYGLHDFILDEIRHVQKSIHDTALATNSLPQGIVCHQCKIQNILECRTIGVCTGVPRCTFHAGASNQPTVCPNGICELVRNGIKAAHRYNKPSWKNTHAELWSTDPWEIAKCFLPPDGYADVSSVEETDFNGVISIILNCSTFQQKISINLAHKTNVLIDATDIARRVLQSTELTVGDTDLTFMFKTLTTLLTACISTNARAALTLSTISKLNAGTDVDVNSIIAFSKKDMDIQKKKNADVKTLNANLQKIVKIVKSLGKNSKEKRLSIKKHGKSRKHPSHKTKK